MPLALLSLFAGIITVITPCVLPVLPVILAGSASGKSKWRPYWIIGFAAFSMLIFSLLLHTALRFTPAFEALPDRFWIWFSSGVFAVFGLSLLFPTLWDEITRAIGFEQSSQKFMQASAQNTSVLGPALLGLALGPIFTSCSPTYFVILGILAGESVIEGLGYLVLYIGGLSATLLVIAVFGQSAIQKIKWMANPRGWFRRALGVFFIVLSLAVVTGFDKYLEARLLDTNLYQQVVDFESHLLL